MAVTGASGATSLALAVVAEASASGSWVAMVTVADLGMVAAAEAGLELSRVALVPHVAPDQWPTVVGAMIDAMDVLVVGPPPHLRLGDARRLSTRARERGTVLVTLRGRWAEGADVRLSVGASRWEGPGRGPGHLDARQVEVVGGGRGAAVRERRQWVWLPEGNVTAAYSGSDADALSVEAGGGDDQALVG